MPDRPDRTYPMSPADAARDYAELCQREPQGSPARRGAARLRAEAVGDAYSAMDWALECVAGYRFREAHEALAEARRRDPRFLAARWMAFQYPLDPSPASAEEQAAFSRRWREELAWFEVQDFHRPELAPQVWPCIGSATPFHLHYLEDAIPEMRRYGRLLARMMSALDPGMPPRPMRSGRRRIAVVSAHLREHTVARLFLPLFEGLDRGRFELHFLDLEPGSPDWQARLAAAGTRHAGPRPALAWRQLLGALAPDVIVYPEIGMEPVHQGLAALRLAPVQACLWGHPVTSGLPTIDHALVPDALEPADADAHYHERLVRLPGLGHGLAPALLRAAVDAPAGLRRDDPDALEILCAQSVFKLLPAQDAVFARILRALPQARLHLTPLVPAETVADLRARMRSAFEREGVDLDARVVMHGRMPLERFQALAAACDFGLDTLGWSGGMSALDLLPQGLPIVAVEGPTMRSRQTAALLRWLDTPEPIARDAEDMVQVAQRLGTDASLRARLRGQLRARASRLYASADTQAAFAEFLASARPVEAG
jgi:predicted O-linked N-acetylglucosamine transferase (SPINDLY family)